MPCESCRVQFTVFRRKRSCVDCKRYYCSSCLSTVKRNINSNNNVHFSSTDLLCDRCAVFAKRPLLRADLLQLKPKDLIFYLQSKHISTKGCVEKDELVGLVLNHVRQTDSVHSASSSSARSNAGDPTTSSFDSLKQTCQNFFSNITENISDSFSAFDNKATPKSTGQRRSSGHGSTGNAESSHIFDQPRVSTREMPTYASCQSVNECFGPATTSNDRSITHNPSLATIRNMEVESATESAFASHNAEHLDDTRHIDVKTDKNVRAAVEGEEEELNSECECSDDELIATFSRCAMGNSIDRDPSRKETLKSLTGDGDASGPSITSMNTNTDSGTCSGSGLGGYKVDPHGGEISSQSSFEELGAIGGISDDSKAATDTNSSNLDQWQILDNTLEQSQGSSLDFEKRDNKGTTLDRQETSSVPVEEALQLVLLYQPNSQLQPSVVPQRVKKVTRRRSDSYLNRQRQRPVSEDDSPTQSTKCRAGAFTLPEDEVLDMSRAMHSMDSVSCHRCGKHKSNLRQQVEKMRLHLESSQMSEADIKRELQAFLTYLEKRSKSIDCSDTETVASSLSGTNCAQTTTPAPVQQQRQRRCQFQHLANDNEGINVYSASSAGAKSSRFINLEDFDSLKELESLSVKQLKEVLMLNRVDYKGCCEKQELLERVERLWKNLKSTPAIDKLQTDELCKICMDAPIECVILECGHMATCTNCGKVLSECPICRQYIVRVVRFFRA